MDDRALLAAVLAEPDDDLPRLAYADWLEEHGEDARAEFIRLQLELARTPLVEDRHLELTTRCRQLEEDHREGWLRETPLGIWIGGFSRGFPERVSTATLDQRGRLLGEEQFASLTRATERFPLRVFAAQLLGAVSPSVARFPQPNYPLAGNSPLERLAAWPGLGRFTTLDVGMERISFGVEDFRPGIVALAGSAHVANLATLRLSGLHLDEETVFLLGRSSRLPRLRALDLRYSAPLQDHLGFLLDTSLVDRLEEFDGADLDTAARWLRRPGCRLSGLGIMLDHHEHAGTDVDRVDFGPLIGARGWAGLRRSSLTFDGPAQWEDRSAERHEVIAQVNLQAVLAELSSSRLEELNIRGLALDEADLTSLTRSPIASTLVTLRLERCALRGGCLSSLRSLLATGPLRHLDLSRNHLVGADGHTIATWPELRRLHRLWLDGNDVEESGLEAIQRSPHRHPLLQLSG